MNDKQPSTDQIIAIINGKGRCMWYISETSEWVFWPVWSDWNNKKKNKTEQTQFRAGFERLFCSLAAVDVSCSFRNGNSETRWTKLIFNVCEKRSTKKTCERNKILINIITKIMLLTPAILFLLSWHFYVCSAQCGKSVCDNAVGHNVWRCRTKK